MIQSLIDILQRLRRPVVSVVLTDPKAVLPVHKTEAAAGYDLTSIESVVIPARGRALVHTGLCVAPPRHCHIEVRPRSGLALKYGITVLNTPGTIDADYRGEIMVIMLNTSETDYHVEPGDRIAQAVIMRHADAIWKPAASLGDTERGSRGFGSTGKK